MEWFSQYYSKHNCSHSHEARNILEISNHICDGARRRQLAFIELYRGFRNLFNSLKFHQLNLKIKESVASFNLSFIHLFNDAANCNQVFIGVNSKCFIREFSRFYDAFTPPQRNNPQFPATIFSRMNFRENFIYYRPLSSSFPNLPPKILK